MVNRFICPATRLVELAAALVPTMKAGEEPWPVSVLMTAVDGEWAASMAEDAAAAAAFAAEMAPAAYIDLIETRIPGSLAGSDRLTEEIGDLLPALAVLGPVQAFFEVFRGPDPHETMSADLAVLADTRRSRGAALGAKIRCGGHVEQDFPSPGEVAAFITGCVGHGLPFKATAGLHKPIRHHDPATGFTRHGFLNLLVAAALAATHSLPGDEVTRIVADMDPSNFHLTRRAARWRDTEADASALASVREALFSGYGSCDFEEPVDDLAALGVLPIEAVV